MDVLFITLLNMSIKAGWLIITVVIIRALFKNMPKWTRCILWGLVAVRLICPYAFESRLSLVPDTRVVSILKEPDYLYSPDATDTAIGTALKDVYYSPKDGEISSLNQEGIEKDNSIKYAITKHIVSFVNTDIISPQNIFHGIEAVWLIGFFALISYAIVNYIKLRKSISEAIPFNYEGYQNDRKYAVMIADAVKTPFITGVLFPKIYIPSDTGEAEIKYILAHEMTHIKRKDYLWKLIGYAVLAVYCFNPLIWIAYALFCRDLELACDEKVISKYDDNEKRSYSETLLLCSMQKKSVLCCPPAFGETAVKERIKAVINHKKTKISIIIVSIVVCVMVAVCFLTNPVTSSAMVVAKDYGENAQISIAGEGVESEALLTGDVCLSGPIAVQSDNLNDVFSKELRDEYAKFGLTCDESGSKMMYKGKPVKFFYDGTGEGKPEDWFAGSNVLYTYVDESGEVYIHTVRDTGHFDKSGSYESGKLRGIEKYSSDDIKKLNVTNTQIEIEEGDVILTASSEASFDNAGYEMSFTDNSENYYIVTVKEMTVSDRFKQYEDYDITYKEKSGQSGKGNVYYKGELINSFGDVNPKEGTFTYKSVDKGNINVTVIYNKKGERIGIEVQK